MKFCSSVLIVLILFVSSNSQTIEYYEVKLDSCNAELSKLNDIITKISSKYLSFKIRGKIVDRNEDLTLIQIWGVAIPENNDYTEYGARLEESNIYVLNPNRDRINYTYYLDGVHYFRGKDYGKNAFGIDVPVYTYGDMDNIYDAIVYRVSVDKKEELLTQKKEIEFKLNDLKMNLFYLKGDSLLKNNKYNECITHYNQGLSLSKSYKEKTLEKLLYAYIAKSNYLCVRNEYHQAFNCLKDYYSIDGNYIFIDEVKKQQSLVCEREAEYYISKSDYLSAIKSLDRTKDLNIKQSKNWDNLYAKSNYYVGMSEISNRNIDTGVNYLNIASSINKNYRISAQTALDKFKKPASLLGCASIIPGLGQAIQKRYSAGTIHFVSFSFFIINGSRYGSDELDEKNSNYLCAGLIMLYSIVNSYNTANIFNTKLQIDDNFEVSINSNALNIYVKI